MKDIHVSRLGSALHPTHSLECRQCGEEYYGEAARTYLEEVSFVNSDGKDETVHVCASSGGGLCMKEFIGPHKSKEVTS